MNSIRKGNVVLEIELTPGAKERLVKTLLRIYRSHTADQLTSLVSRPKPLVLIRNVEGSRAGRLIEALRSQGIPLRFVPSEPPAQSPPRPASSASQASPGTGSGIQPRGETADPAPSTIRAAAAPSFDSPGSPGGPIGFADTPTPADPQDKEPPPSAAPTAPQGARRRHLGLQFTGSTGEYFRIWIVNAALTILTLGTYAPWAKVRTRRYFYANTLLDGQPFDYLAKPGTILRGYLIVGFGLLVMNVSTRISPLVGSLITAAAWLTVPFLLYKAHRFKAKYSAYRNIRFRFTGNVGQAYRAYALIPLGVLVGLAITLPVLLYGDPETHSMPRFAEAAGAGFLGILFLITLPYFIYLQRRYLHDNMAYGKTLSAFRGGVRRFYGIYVSAFFILIVSFILGGVFMGMTASALIPRGAVGAPGKIHILGLMAVIYAVFGLIFILVQQYVYAGTFNYSWSNTQLGPISFSVSLQARTLAWIRFTNVLAIIFSLGLLIPWAKIRRARYILPRTTAFLPADMSVFTAAEDSKVSAVGDTAADFFDWDIGW